jgi:signal transduction histidine kinase
MEYKPTIRFASSILQRLGEELNTSPDQGIIELIKNAYDADATTCLVELVDLSRPQGQVIVTDNGDGMDAEGLQDGWLVLGRSKKHKEELTRLGRVPAGDKGLGRLAAIRMGRKVNVTSVSRKDKYSRYSLEIDWSLFDNAELVSDVGLQIQTETNARNLQPGTCIAIQSLIRQIGLMDVRRLARAMILLADPFGDTPSGFQPALKAPGFPEMEKLVLNRYFGDAEFHLSASLNSEGIGWAVVNDWKDERLYEAEHLDLRPRTPTQSYSCPACTFDMWVFVLDEPTFATRSTTRTEVQAWLREFGGVHLYYNGIRVSPYGDVGDDWLGLNLMRVRSPELRPSTNTAIGRMMLDDRSGVLIQKTDRSGFIENDSFLELKRFATDALNWMARRRLEERERKRASTKKEVERKTSQTKESVKEAIAKAPVQARRKIEEAFIQYEKAHAREVVELKREVQLYRTLSTVGITAAVFAHESANNPVKLIGQSMRTIRTRAKKLLADKYAESLEKPVERILQSVEALRVLGAVTLSLVDHEKRRASRVDIHKVIRSTIDLFDPFIVSHDTTVELQFDAGDPYLRASIAALESIVANLINNSVAAFERTSPGERRILIRTVVAD